MFMHALLRICFNLRGTCVDVFVDMCVDKLVDAFVEMFVDKTGDA